MPESNAIFSRPDAGVSVHAPVIPIEISPADIKSSHKVAEMVADGVNRLADALGGEASTIGSKIKGVSRITSTAVQSLENLRDVFAPIPWEELTREQKDNRLTHDKMVEDYHSTVYGKASVGAAKLGLYAIPLTRTFKAVRATGAADKALKMLNLPITPTTHAIVENAMVGMSFDIMEKGVTSSELTLESLALTTGAFAAFGAVEPLAKEAGLEIMAWWKNMKTIKELKGIAPNAKPEEWYVAFTSQKGARKDLVEILKLIPETDKTEFMSALVRNGKAAQMGIKPLEVPNNLSVTSGIYKKLYDTQFTSIEKTMSAKRIAKGNSAVNEVDQFVKDRLQTVRDAESALNRAMQKSDLDFLAEAELTAKESVVEATKIGEIHPLLKRAVKPFINSANTVLNKVRDVNNVMGETGAIRLFKPTVELTTPTTQGAKDMQEFFQTTENKTADLYKQRVMKGVRKFNQWMNNPNANIERQLMAHPLKMDSQAQQTLADMSLHRGSNSRSDEWMKEVTSKYFEKYTFAERKELSRIATLQRNIVLADFDIARKMKAMDRIIAAKNNIKAQKDILKKVNKEQRKGIRQNIAKEETLIKRLQEQVKAKLNLPGGEGAKQKSLAYLNDIEPKFLKRAQTDLNGLQKDVFNKILDEKLAEGIISKVDYDAMLNVGFYNPTRWLDKLDPVMNYRVGSRTLNVTASGKPQAKGSGQSATDEEMRLIRAQQHIVEDIEIAKEAGLPTKTLEGQYDEIQGIINEQKNLKGLVQDDIYTLAYHSIKTHNNVLLRNRAATSAARLAESTPNNGIFMTPIKGTSIKGVPTKGFEKPPIGWTEIYRLENGVQKPTWIREEFADEWLAMAPSLQGNLTNMIGWFTGQRIVKFAATGAGNPLWGFTNIMLDSSHLYASAYQYSNSPFKFAMELSSDIKRVSKSVITKKGIYEDYSKDGGLMNFLSQESELSVPIKTANYGLEMPNALRRGAAQAQSAVNFLNSSSEVVIRLAHYRRAAVEMAQKKGIKNADKLGWNSLKRNLSDGERRRAAYAARSRMDFPHAGEFWHLLDTMWPYTKAGFVAGRGTFRGVRDNKTSAIIRAGYATTLSAGIAGAGWMMAPETMKQIPVKTRTNNWCIPLKLSTEDTEGNKIPMYLKFRKDPALRVVSGVVEGMMDELLGNRAFDWERFADTVTEVIPWNPEVGGAPFLYAYLGWKTGRDPRTGQKISRHPEFKPEDRVLEADEFIHPIFTEIGRDMNVSPYRLRYTLQQYFGYNNPFVALTGHLTNEVFKEIPLDDRKTIEQKALSNPVLKPFLGLGTPREYFRKPMLDANLEDNAVKYKQNQSLNIALKLHFQNPEQYDKDWIKEFVKEIAPVSRWEPLFDRATQWITVEQKRKELAAQFDGGFVPLDRLLALAGMPSPEAKAIATWKIMLDLPEDKGKAFYEVSKEIPGFWSERVLMKWNELLDQVKKGEQ